MASKKKSDPANVENINETASAPENEAAETDTPKEETCQQPEHDYKADFDAEHDRYLRLAAEYDNFRKRSQKEREALYADARGDTVLKLLPVYDNLARALAQETSDEAYKKGVEMTMNQLCDILKKLGVEAIPALGETFDPLRHNAVMHVDDDSVGENMIVEEFEKGFMLGDKVIRFSMVKVAN